ncbi:LPXTG cell wall anchor domain-containing protein [Streptomyces sp. NPDC059247]|uniref:LPXTG cell wall anchor domain-containing protein n=1 Tax=Streptomyces sp. NPDC059247 TaxID=3346790 RepID=UPI0036B2C93C
MTKQMRVRIARIAAGAVIAAGASLTAAGAAQAVGIFSEGETPTPTDTCMPGGAGCETTPPPTTEPPTTPPPTTEPPTTPPPTTEPPTTPPPTTEPPTTPPPTTEPPTEPPTTPPTEPPTEPPTTPPTTNPPVTTPPTEPGPGETTEPGPGSTGTPTTPDDGGEPGTCTVDLDGAECVDGGNSNVDTDGAGSQPVQQGQAKEELAETGAAETSFLVIGAATMIAGGIGFRMLPRLVGGGRAAV